MRNSSICPSRNGSALYCDRPIQLFVVLPRLEGLRVILVFWPTCAPFTYSVPTLPDFVTATCVHAPVGNADVPLMRCSAPDPPVVIAKRMVEPFVGVRNILTVVPVPKSKIRRQALVVSSLTHVAIVKSLRPL